MWFFKLALQREKMTHVTSYGRHDYAAAFSFTTVRGVKVTAACDDDSLTLDGSVLVLTQAERMMWVCWQLTSQIADPRDTERLLHQFDDI